MDVSKPKKRKGRRALIVVLILAAILVIPVLTLVIYTLLNGTSPEKVLRDDYSMYVSVPSASHFVEDILHLRALDAVLSDPAMGDIRGVVRSLRSEPFIHSESFAKISDVRVDAAIYGNADWIVAADLGLRSVLVPPALFLARTFPFLLERFEGLSLAAVDPFPILQYRMEDVSLYIAFYRDIVFLSETPELIVTLVEPDNALFSREISTLLGKTQDSSLRLLVNPNDFLEALVSDNNKAFLDALEFPSKAVLDLVLDRESIQLKVQLPVGSNDEAIGNLVGMRSRTASVLSRFPASAAYYTLFSAAAPKQLLDVSLPYLPAELSLAYNDADKAVNAVFGMGLDKAFLNWMGSEMGMFSLKNNPAPVFFVSVSDERARRAAFDTIFDSFLVGTDTSSVVEGLRLPRIAFPSYIKGLMKAFDIALMEPFYIIEDDVLYASPSAEALALAVLELRERQTLVKTDIWRSIGSNVSSESGASVFYNLERSIPFFMRSNSGISNLLSLYGQGLASLRFYNKAMHLELYAQVSSDKTQRIEIPGFPQKSKRRIETDPLVVYDAARVPRAFWTSGKRVEAMDLRSGSIQSLEADDTVYITLETEASLLKRLWAVSKRGTLYQLSPELEPFSGFPLLSGEDVSAPPLAAEDNVYVPLSAGPALLILDADSTLKRTEPFGSRLHTAPLSSGNGLVFLPRSFDSSLYYMDYDGTIKESWPVYLPGIVSAKPLVFSLSGLSSGQDELRIAAITEAGDLSVYLEDGSIQSGFPVKLEGTYDTAPVWSDGYLSLYALSVEAVLWRIHLDGTVSSSVAVPRGPARGSTLTALDWNENGFEELYVSGGGDALYAFSGELHELDSFPRSGFGAPSCIDIDSDGLKELVVRGSDDTIHAYSMPEGVELD